MMSQHEIKLKLLGLAIEAAKATVPPPPAGPAEPTLGTEALNRNLQMWETTKIFYNGFVAAMNTDSPKDGFALPAVPADTLPTPPATPTAPPATGANPATPAPVVAPVLSKVVPAVAAAAGTVLQSLIPTSS